MSQPGTKLAVHDPVWSEIRESAALLANHEPVLASLLYATVLNQSRL